MKYCVLPLSPFAFSSMASVLLSIPFFSCLMASVSLIFLSISSRISLATLFGKPDASTNADLP
ncbi:hypothetical protein [Arsenophonus nasoniae]|uniref:Uncharacterized protein n=1 Tax=Arsenophonus nasoniae TaxID=638 RepID=A0ABY8NL31_9GAMM|nr:hypothetical protein [Arsenophonus nasoniae]WGM04998.1 hypothetical protein QE258_15645 [Arsenophonus nasoniae]WGM05070.1 hypothetical protein QE258_16070 [Arsenophonus nasoniae]WGM07437.1 hypothetical protein QE258_09455 [Arsenophonus nasoniae]